jgi:hypothetical protein
VDEGRWPAIRAGLFALHLGGLTLLGLPQPALRDGDLDEPFVAEFFEGATRDLRRLGFDVTVEQVTERGIAWGRGYLAVFDAVNWPTKAYARATGSGQSWRMFASVPEESAVLYVEARVDGEWRAVHWMRFREPRWRSWFWDQERIRAMCNQFTHKKNRSAWNRLGKVIHPWLQADFPEATGFRMAMRTVQFPLPAVLDDTGDVVWGDGFWVTELGRKP